MDEQYLDTIDRNAPFKHLMRTLALDKLQTVGGVGSIPEHPQEFGLIYRVSKKLWEEARVKVLLQWMPPQQRALSKDGSPSFLLLKHSNQHQQHGHSNLQHQSGYQAGQQSQHHY